MEAKNNKIKVVIKENSSCAPVKLIKNSKPVQIREAKLDLNSNEQFSEPSVRYYDKFKDTIPARKKEKKSMKDIIKEITIDQAVSMTSAEKELFEDTIKKFPKVLGEDLPGYNN